MKREQIEGEKARGKDRAWCMRHRLAQVPVGIKKERTFFLKIQPPTVLSHR